MCWLVKDAASCVLLVQETLSCAVQLAVQWLEEQQLVAVHCSNVELREKVRRWMEGYSAFCVHRIVLDAHSYYGMDQLLCMAWWEGGEAHF